MQPGSITILTLIGILGSAEAIGAVYKSPMGQKKSESKSTGYASPYFTPGHGAPSYSYLKTKKV